MTDFIRENSSQLLHYMNLPCLTSGYFILSYFPQLNYVFYKFCNYLYCHFDPCHVSEFNDIIAYIALQKQPVLCGDTQRQKSLAVDAFRLFVVCLMVSVITVTEKEHPV